MHARAAISSLSADEGNELYSRRHAMMARASGDGLRRSESTSALLHGRTDSFSLTDSLQRSLRRSSVSTPALQNCLQQIVDDELVCQRSKQIDDLASKVRALEYTKKRAIGNMCTMEQQHQRRIDSVQQQLESLLAQRDGMRKEIHQLERKLANWSPQVDAHLPRRDQILRESETAEADVHRLAELRSKHEVEAEATRVEVAELRRKLDRTLAEHWKARDESAQESNAAASVHHALDDAAKRLQDSEQQRVVLLRRYAEQGDTFQQVLFNSESASQRLVKKLADDARHHKKLYRKYRMSLEHMENELKAEDVAMRLKQGALEDKVVEVGRLQETLEHERILCRKREWQYNGCLNVQHEPHRPDTILIATHHSLLEEQAEHFRGSMREMEHKWALEAEVHQARVAHREPQSELSAIFSCSPPTPCSDQAPPWASSTRAALQMCVDATRRTEERADAIEAELGATTQDYVRLEQLVSEANKNMRALAGSVQEEAQYLQELQRAHDKERQLEASMELRADKVRAETMSCEEELAGRGADVRKLKALASVNAEFKDRVDEHCHALTCLDEQRDHFKGECTQQRLELSTLEKEHNRLMSDLSQAQQHESKAEVLCERRANALHRKREVWRQAQDFVRVHLKDARRRMEQLSEEAQSDLLRINRLCVDNERRFDKELHQIVGRARATDMEMSKLQDDAQANESQLEQKIQAGIVDNRHLDSTLEQARFDDMKESELREELQKTVQHSRDCVERVLTAVSCITPPIRGFDQAVSETCDAESNKYSAVVDFLDRLRDAIGAAHEQAICVATQLTRDAGERRLEAAARAETINAIKRRADLDAKCHAAEAECEEMAQKVRRARAEVRARQTEHAKRSTGLLAEIEDRESELSAINLKKADRASELSFVMSQMESFNIASSLSLELSLTDVVEPLKSDLQSLLAEVDQLQNGFLQQLEALDRKFRSQCSEEQTDHEEHEKNIRAASQEELEAQKREIHDDSMAETHVFEIADRAVSELRDKLVRSWAELDEERSANLCLRDQAEAALQEETRHQIDCQTADGKLAQARRARQLAQEAIGERRLELLRKHDSEFAQLRRGMDHDISSLRARWQQSISGLSAVSLEDDALSLFSPNANKTLLFSPPARLGATNTSRSPPPRVGSTMLRRSTSKTSLDGTPS